jgi:hypothetical protein
MCHLIPISKLLKTLATYELKRGKQKELSP